MFESSFGPLFLKIRFQNAVKFLDVCCEFLHETKWFFVQWYAPRKHMFSGSNKKVYGILYCTENLIFNWLWALTCITLICIKGNLLWYPKIVLQWGQVGQMRHKFLGNGTTGKGICAGIGIQRAQTPWKRSGYKSTIKLSWSHFYSSFFGWQVALTRSQKSFP